MAISEKKNQAFFEKSAKIWAIFLRVKTTK